MSLYDVAGWACLAAAALSIPWAVADAPTIRAYMRSQP